jgi:hypothetical protein
MLWGITCYFNPAGYQNRLINYRLFRSRLNVPLVAVELSFTGEFELRADDAEILLQIAGGDVMWQKERLLNIALSALPRECDIVAWLDCDVIFASPTWADDARHALKDNLLVQLFNERLNLIPGARDDSAGSACVELSVPGAAFKFATGTLRPEDLCVAASMVSGRATNGLAWAASRELVQAHGFYDTRIIGSGDKAIFCAAIGKFEYPEQAANMNARQREHYRNWATPFFADIRARVGFLEGRVFHLWHGTPNDRQHQRRHQLLTRHEFDPFVDIALDSNRVWRWNSDKAPMHEAVRRYFASRDEDRIGDSPSRWVCDKR